MSGTIKGTASQFLADAERARRHGEYRLTLYVAGTTPRSALAIVNVRELCEEQLLGRYVLEVIDITSQAMTAVAQQVIAVPLLVREQPLPMRRFVGDMSDRARLLAGLDLVG